MIRAADAVPIPAIDSSRRSRLAERTPRLTRFLIRFLKGRGGLQVSRCAALGLRLCPRFAWVWALRALERSGGHLLSFQLASPEQSSAGSESLRALAQPKHLRWLFERLTQMPAHGKARLLALGLSQVARVVEHGLANRDPATGERLPARLRWLIVATTDACNLRCVGCYTKPAWENRHVDFPQLAYLAAEAERMGVEAIIVTGWGEPFFNRKDKANLFRLCEEHPGMLFVVFTNGTLLTEADLDTVQRLGNLFLLISLDGLERTNDARRGKDGFRRVAQATEALGRRRMLFGISVTVTSANYREVTSAEFIETMQAWGALWILYLRFTPSPYPAHQGDGDSLRLSPVEVLRYLQLLGVAREQHAIPVVDADEVERLRGGCTARAGDLAFVDAVTGRVSGCLKLPFAPVTHTLFTPPETPGRLAQLLHSEYFEEYWKEVSCSWRCTEGCGSVVVRGERPSFDRRAAADRSPS